MFQNSFHSDVFQYGTPSCPPLGAGLLRLRATLGIGAPSGVKCSRSHCRSYHPDFSYRKSFGKVWKSPRYWALPSLVGQLALAWESARRTPEHNLQIQNRTSPQISHLPWNANLFLSAPKATWARGSITTNICICFRCNYIYIVYCICMHMTIMYINVYRHMCSSS